MVLEKKHGYCIINLKSRFSFDDPSRFQKIVPTEIYGNIKSVIVNLEAVDYVGSSGPAILKKIKDMLTPMGVEMYLMNVHDEVYKILRLTKLYIAFTIIENEEVIAKRIDDEAIREVLNPNSD